MKSVVITYLSYALKCNNLSVVPINIFTCSISFCSPGVVIAVVLRWIILLMLPSS